MKIVVTMDQLVRPQPGGIGTYVRGLVRGLATAAPDAQVIGVGPRGLTANAPIHSVVASKFSEPVLTRLWRSWPASIPRDAHVLHLTSLAGPVRRSAGARVHAITLQDLLWRDDPSTFTPRGRSFHEDRFRDVVANDHLRVLVTTDAMVTRCLEAGISTERLHRVTLGADDVYPDVDGARALLAQHGVGEHFTLSVGTIEPRKNLERLVVAHRRARTRNEQLGPLVLVGATGWGDVNTDDAVRITNVSAPVRTALYELCHVFAYVPLREGWGLPPIEALRRGARCVVSTTTPSGDGLPVVRVEPTDDEALADALTTALALPNDPVARQQRHDAVASYTWESMAREHVVAWR